MSLSLTLIIVIMTGLISYQAFNNPDMRAKLIFYPTAVKNRKEYYRFLSHGLIHGDFGHLFINMFVLWQFGEFVELLFTNGVMTSRFIIPPLFGPATGRIMFVFFYFSAIVIASIPDYLRHQNNPGYAALGASGATSALVFSYILFDPWQWFIFPPVPAILVAIGYLWYSNYMDKRGGDNIGHNAHYWGAIYGIAFIVLAVAINQPQEFQNILSRFLQGPETPSFLG